MSRRHNAPEVVGDPIVTVVSVYATQSGLAQNVKDAFYDDLSVSCLKENKILLPCGVTLES